MALQLARELLQEVMGMVSAHHQGTAAGQSGLTFEMICAACQSSDAALDVSPSSWSISSCQGTSHGTPSCWMGS